jgi:predicted alpha/beta hydrolase family esterase
MERPTRRLLLKSATIDLAEAEIQSIGRFSSLIGAAVPHGWPPGEYDRSAQEFFLKRLRQGTDGLAGWYSWYAILTDGPTRTLIGAGGFLGPPVAAGSVEVGFSIHTDWTGRGFATEMVGELVVFAFEHESVKRVVGNTTRENKGSCTVFSHLGFREEDGDPESGTVRFVRDAVATLILPGLGSSGPMHWQSLWEQRDPSFRRVLQDNWDTPSCSDWVRRLDDAIRNEAGPIVLVAHSSACALVAHWHRSTDKDSLRKVRGALLVAPSDPEGPGYPRGPVGFGPVPMDRIPFPTVVVASTNDPYITIEKARDYAKAWDSRLIILEGAGHINSSSGLADWPRGLALLSELQRGSA